MLLLRQLLCLITFVCVVSCRETPRRSRTAHDTLKYVLSATNSTCSRELQSNTFLCKKVGLASLVSDFLDRKHIALSDSVVLVKEDGQGLFSMSQARKSMPKFLTRNGDTIDQLLYIRFQEFLTSHVLRLQFPDVLNASVELALPSSTARLFADPGFHLRLKLPFLRDEFKFSLSTGPSFLVGITVGLIFLAVKGLLSPLFLGLKAFFVGLFLSGSPAKGIFDPFTSEEEELPLTHYPSSYLQNGWQTYSDPWQRQQQYAGSASSYHPQTNVYKPPTHTANGYPWYSQPKHQQVHPDYSYSDYNKQSSALGSQHQSFLGNNSPLKNPGDLTDITQLLQGGGVGGGLGGGGYPEPSASDLSVLADLAAAAIKHGSDQAGGAGGGAGGGGGGGLRVPILEREAEAAKTTTSTPTKQHGFQFIPHSTLQIDSFDPFYSPLLSRIDSIFSHLNSKEEGCRERVVCSIYKFPVKYAPYSNLLSAQLSRHPSELKRPVSNSPLVLRYFKYMKAAKDGQAGNDCLQMYPSCTVDTEQLAHLPMVNTYNQLSELIGTARESNNNQQLRNSRGHILVASSINNQTDPVFHIRRRRG